MPEKDETGIFYLQDTAEYFLLRTRATKEGYNTIARVLTLGGLIKCEQIH